MYHVSTNDLVSHASGYLVASQEEKHLMTRSWSGDGDASASLVEVRGSRARHGSELLLAMKAAGHVPQGDDVIARVAWDLVRWGARNEGANDQGPVVRYFRQLAGYSAGELSSLSGVPEERIVALEEGENLRRHECHAVAAALGIAGDFLVSPPRVNGG